MEIEDITINHESKKYKVRIYGEEVKSFHVKPEYDFVGKEEMNKYAEVIKFCEEHIKL